MPKKKKPFCNKHKIPLMKKQVSKIGEDRYYCIKCEQEKPQQKNND